MPTTRIRCTAERSLARCFPTLRRTCTRGLALLVFGLLAGPAGAADANLETEESAWNEIRWKYSIGFDYSRGDYGLDEDTDLIFMPISVEADLFPVRVKLTVPFLSIDGPSGVRLDGGETVSDNESGLGQIVGSVGYLWVPLSKRLPLVELIGKLSVPSETSDGLGSGEWAFALQADAFKRFGPVLAFGSAGRKFYTGSSLDDRFYTSVGASFRVDEDVNLGVAYDWFQASFDSVEDTHQLSPFASFKIGGGWSLGPYGLIGLSNGAPDIGMGVTLSLRR